MSEPIDVVASVVQLPATTAAAVAAASVDIDYYR
jgi:hypothetical protein